MSKFITLVLILQLKPITAFGFLDFIAKESKELIEVAAVADATADLMSEVVPDNDLSRDVATVSESSNRIREGARNANYVSHESRMLIEGPQWTSKRLDSNIRETTSFIRRGKRIALSLAALGTNGLIAANGVQTNLALNEIQKNQQVLMIQNNQLLNRQLAQEVDEAKAWQSLISKQRNYRYAGQSRD